MTDKAKAEAKAEAEAKAKIDRWHKFWYDVEEYVHWWRASDRFDSDRDPTAVPAPTWLVYLSAIWATLKYDFGKMLCKHYGHKMKHVPEASHTGPESAEESFCCRRCGYTSRVIY